MCNALFSSVNAVHKGVDTSPHGRRIAPFVWWMFVHMSAVVLRFKCLFKFLFKVVLVLVLILMVPAIGFTQASASLTSTAACGTGNTDYMCISASPKEDQTVSIRLFNKVTDVSIDWDDGDSIQSGNVCSTITAKDQDGNNISGTTTVGQSVITNISNSTASDTDAVILSCTYENIGNYTIALGGSFFGYGWHQNVPYLDAVPAITGVTHWGNTGIQSLSGAFRKHSNFVQVPDYLPDSVTSLGSIFERATVFNGDIGGWDTSNVTDMSYMFSRVKAFNGDIGDWDTSAVTNMKALLFRTYAFNQDIGDWDTSNVTDMGIMFYVATAFNQDLSQWDVSEVTEMANIFSSAELSANNYDALITSWNSQLTLQSVSFNGGNSRFCETAIGNNQDEDPSYSDDNPDTVYDCSPRITRVTLDNVLSTSLALTVTFSEPVFANNDGTGALEADDFVVSITDSDTGTGATLNGTPTSISQQGNSYTLDVAITGGGTLQADQVIEVLPKVNRIYDANGNAASGS